MQTNGFHPGADGATSAPGVMTQASQQAPVCNGNGSRPTTIYQKISAVYDAVQYIQKDKRNSFHGYNYASEAAIKAKLHEAFSEHGLLLLPPEILELRDGDREPNKLNSQGKETKGEFLTTIKVKLAIADRDSGEKVEGILYGRGQDSGDKGIYKALTGALKQFLTTTFMIATGDDPERDDEPEPQPRNQRRQGRQQPPAPEQPSRATNPAPPAPTAPNAAPPLSVLTRQDFFGSNQAGRRGAFREAQGILNPDVYSTILGAFGVDRADEFKSANQAWGCYEKLVLAVRDQIARQNDPRSYEHFVAGEGGVQ